MRKEGYKNYTPDKSLLPNAQEEEKKEFWQNPLHCLRASSARTMQIHAVSSEVWHYAGNNSGRMVAEDLSKGQPIGIDEFIELSIEYGQRTNSSTVTGVDVVNQGNGKSLSTVTTGLACNTAVNSMAQSLESDSIAACNKSASISITRGANSAAVCGGYASIAKSAGFAAIAACVREKSVAITTGNDSAAIGNNFNTRAVAEGNTSVAIVNGFKSEAKATGYVSVALSTQRDSSSEVKTTNSVACALGLRAKARGGLGSWLVVAERYDSTILSIVTAKVDGETVLPDTWYEVKNGLLVQCVEQQG